MDIATACARFLAGPTTLLWVKQATRPNGDGADASECSPSKCAPGTRVTGHNPAHHGKRQRHAYPDLIREPNKLGEMLWPKVHRLFHLIYYTDHCRYDKRPRAEWKWARDYIKELIAEIHKMSGVKLLIDIYYPDDLDVDPTVNFIVERYTALYFSPPPATNRQTQAGPPSKVPRRTTCGD